MMEDGSSLMRVLARAVRMGDPSLVMIGGSGTVSVYPRHQCYVSDIQDWSSVYAAQPEQIRVMPTAWVAPPPAGALPLEGLQWRAAYSEALKQPADVALPRELVHLLEWPNLTRVPDDLVPAVIRVCALLWRKPTVGFLLPRILGLPAEQVGAVVQALQQFGHVRVARSDNAAASAEAASAAEAEVAAAAPSATTSLVGKFWQRLVRF